MVGDNRGILYPQHLPVFAREESAADIAHLVRWFWTARWDLPAGEVSRQHILAFPASNLVVQPGGVTVAGPSTGASHRDLRGSGRVVAALLRPAGLAALGLDPGEIRNREVPLDRAIAAGSVADLADWVRRELLPVPLPDAALTANELEHTVATDRGVLSVEDLAARLRVSVRSVQRLARRYIGVPPLAVIRRYRLQESAELLRTDPSVTVADVAAHLGYADQAHLAADFRTVLGLSPSAYRRRSDPPLAQ